ncbi:MAG: COX15/CtaA family protein [Cyclobacteriaceae bacterium]
MLSKSFYLKINIITLRSVLVLILVGSIVRSTGAGMGCPDWPKCFGSYVPPTSTDQLPENYLETFRAERLKKNERLASLLSKLGYEKLSNQILTDPLVQEEQAFNVTKAWIEYVNRLIGVLIGLLVFINMIWAFAHKEKKGFVLVGIFIFVLTGFQGWVGSLVVSTNLLKGFITFHMILALVIVALLIWMNVKAQELTIVRNRKLFLTTLILLILFVPQLLMGTEVRHVVDLLLVSEPDRSLWANSLTEMFLYHRSYSWIILIGSLFLLNRIRKQKIIELNKPASALLAMIGLIGVVGVIMTNFNFPFWTQPLHLILATGIFSILFYLILRLKPA